MYTAEATATVYAPAIRVEDGRAEVIFAEGHPGLTDPDYQRHRGMIADAAFSYVPGGPIPEVVYTAREHELWRLVGQELQAKHERFACAEFQHGARRLGLSTERLPQLEDVSNRLRQLTGFRFSPSAGLVDIDKFFASLAECRFQATQFIRHSADPWFCPEPDMIHEIVGHGSALASARVAGIYQLTGQAARRLRDREALELLSRVFWFTMESGLVREDGEVKAFGASLMSSCAELERFRDVRLRPLSVAGMADQEFLVEQYQEVLFCADSFDELEGFMVRFLTTINDANWRMLAEQKAPV